MLYDRNKDCFVATSRPHHTWYVGGNVVPPGDEIDIPLLVMGTDGVPANQGALLRLQGVEGLPGDGMYEVWRSPVPPSNGDDYEPGIDTVPTAAIPRLVVVRLERHTPIEGGDGGDG